jgi:hypothetical protein
MNKVETEKVESSWFKTYRYWLVIAGRSGSVPLCKCKVYFNILQSYTSNSIETTPLQ